MVASIHTDEYKTMIERLRKARRGVGLTQTEVAKKLGKPQSYVSKIEQGERRLDITELKKLASVYKKPVSFFYE